MAANDPEPHPEPDPTVLDCVHALHWLQEASRSQPTSAPA
jgi:hypothetical protein